MNYKMEIYFKKESENIAREYAILLGNQIYWFYTLTNSDFYILYKNKNNQDLLNKACNKLISINTKENIIGKYNLNSILNEIKEVIPEHFV